MKLNASYPVICTDKIQASRDFYVEHFDFEPTFEADWYVSLRSKASPGCELALMDYRHASIPEAFQSPAKGVLINFEVENVDETHERLKSRELPMVLELRSEDWGQRHFITVDPNGILIDVIENIEPSAEFAGQYEK